MFSWLWASKTEWYRCDRRWETDLTIPSVDHERALPPVTTLLLQCWCPLKRKRGWEVIQLIFFWNVTSEVSPSNQGQPSKAPTHVQLLMPVLIPQSNTRKGQDGSSKMAEFKHLKWTYLQHSNLSLFFMCIVYLVHLIKLYKNELTRNSSFRVHLYSRSKMIYKLNVPNAKPKTFWALTWYHRWKIQYLNSCDR